MEKNKRQIKEICRNLFVVVCFFFLLNGCAKGSRLQDALATGEKAGLRPMWIKAGGFNLLAQEKFSDPQKPLRIYIEGDGFAYSQPRRASTDPTPLNPVALSLSSVDPFPNVAWLARPCQYAMLAGLQQNCPDLYWTTHRMSQEIVGVLDVAVTALRDKAGAKQIELVGYSGGGAAAILLAARREDVAAVRTVAGNLDNKAFIHHHNLSPMPQSLDAIDYAEKTRSLPQLHFYGEEDAVVPVSLARAFAAKAAAKTITVPHADHERGWQNAWPRLLQTPLRN